MRYIAVADIKEDFCTIAVFAEGWKSASPVGSGIVRGNFLDREMGAAQKVREEIDRISPQEPAVILLLPRRIVHVTTAEIPAKNKALLGKMMEFEVARHFPIPHDQLVYDFMVVGGAHGGFILNIAGLKRSDFDSYFDAAKEANIKPDEVSFSSAAWILPDVPDDEIKKRTFIEITPAGFEMSVVDGTRLVYSRFNRFRPKLEEKYFYERDVSGLSPDGDISQKISEELNHIRLVTGAEDINVYLEKVFIAGGGALRKGIIRYLAAKPGFSDSIIKSLPVGGDDAGFGYVAAATGALGIDKEGARFNFIPAGMRDSRAGMALKRFKTGSIVIVSLALFWIAFVYSVQWKRAGDLKQELAQLKSKAANVEEVHLRIGEFRSYFESYEKFSMTSSFTIDLLEGLTGALPKNGYLTDIEIRGGRIAISGLSEDASSLLRVMEADPHFKSVRMAGAVKTVGKNEKFSIRMEVE
ncbi:MAG: hypothetical protein IEMM0002_0389 [bacterium]|nr:MAG: hypothetical protein IEMM0002_0389 [bacterium]